MQILLLLAMLIIPASILSQPRNLEKEHQRAPLSRLVQETLNFDQTPLTTAQLNDLNSDNDDEGVQLYDEDMNEEEHIELYDPLDYEYFGNWDIEASGTIPFLTQSKGLAELTISAKDSKIMIHFLDGVYEDKKTVMINIDYDDEDYNESISSFKSTAASMQTEHMNKLKEVRFTDGCSANYELKLTDTATGEPVTRLVSSPTNVSFSLYSLDCQFELKASFSSVNEAYESEVMHYSIAITLMCCVTLYSCISTIKSIADLGFEGNRISILSVSFLTCWDFVFCFLLCYKTMNGNQYFHFFITPIFWYFILAAIFESRLLTILWKVQYLNRIQNDSDASKRLSRFNIAFYASLIICSVTAYYNIHRSWFLLMSGLVYVPQIMHNAIKNLRHKTNYHFMVGICLLRSTLVIYAKGYSDNIFRLTPDYTFIKTYIVVIVLQLVVLYVQSRKPRFFVPSFLLPYEHNYFVELAGEKSDNQEDTCAICIETLSKEPNLNSQTQNSMNRKKNNRIMQTPCKHRFHEQCLKDWLEVKLECPMCKTLLPSIE